MRMISNSNYISLNALYQNGGAYISHHGVKGQKWGVRRELRKSARLAKRDRKISRERDRGTMLRQQKHKTLIGTALGYALKGALSGVIGAGVGLGTALLTANPVLGQVVGQTTATAFASAVAIHQGRQAFDLVLSYGATGADPNKKR